MPTYEYQCQACGHSLEEFQKMSDSPLRKCPECGKNKLQKQVSASAFHLKGSGWYVTDFKDKGKPEAEVSVDTKTDAKTEASKAQTDEKKHKSHRNKVCG